MKNSLHVSKKLITLSIAGAMLLSFGSPLIASANSEKGKHNEDNRHKKVAVHEKEKEKDDDEKDRDHDRKLNDIRNRIRDHMCRIEYKHYGFFHNRGIFKKYHCDTINQTKPVVIGTVSKTNISTSSAMLSWDTSKAASSAIFISTSTPVATTTAVWTDASLATAHSVTLTGLLPGTTYSFVIKSNDATTTTFSSVGTFTTLSVTALDVTAPLISSLTVQNLAPTTATLTWNTNEFARSEVFVSSSTPVSTSSAQWTDSILRMPHSAVLTTLSPNTVYHFVVKAIDASGNISLSPEGTFTTSVLPDTMAPVISGILTTVTGSTSASIAWTSNESATSKVWYSTTSPVNTATAPSLANTALVTAHSIVLPGLSASTTYYAMIESRDAVNNAATSSQFLFTTNP